MTVFRGHNVEATLPFIAIACVVAAIVVVLIAPRGGSTVRLPAARHLRAATASAHSGHRSDAGHGHGTATPGGPSTGGSGLTRPSPAKPKARTHPASSSSHTLSLPKAIGQVIIATYQGTEPSPTMLAAVRAGQTGAIILMGDNTSGGTSSTRTAVDELQSAARAGHNPALLIMTDQEGGEVKRLAGPPDYAASQMSNYNVAYTQGIATGKLLREAGVNLDLAPVADVSRVDGFMTQDQRTFGNNPAVVAKAACSFALGLASQRIGFTLKHFPGLGDAIDSTDNEPVSITEPAREIHDDDAAYRECGNDPLASVMVSSASYTNLTGSTPAVLSSLIYHKVLPSDGVTGVTMSDSFESGAVENLPAPARQAISAGLDMVMYPGLESASSYAYNVLLQDATHGSLSPSRVQAAAQAVLAYKRQLGLG